jgi:conjugative relaxase-like TrwC/TraI family protein
VDQVATDSHDYYAGHGEEPGRWHGRFAAALGLEGEVTAEQFRAVLEGVDPATGQRLKPRANRRVAAWDVTFSPPKSISALWAIAPDDARETIAAAQAAAVDAAVGYLTREACVARLGRAGSDRQDASKVGFLRCDFTHRCSREGDPQLHSHTILANVVQASDGRRAALDGGLTYQHAKAADGAYQSALRAELTARLGVGWIERDGHLEVDGIPADLCRQWSKRRRQIERALAARGLNADASPRAAQAATLDTRQAKVRTEPGGSLHARFVREAANAGYHPDKVLAAFLGPRRVVGDLAVEDARLLDELVGPRGVTEQASSFSRREVISDIAARRAVHATNAADAVARIEQLADALIADDRVVAVLAPAARTTGELLRVRDNHGRVVRTVDLRGRRYTTVDLLAAEHELLTRARTRQRAGVAIIPDHIVDRALTAHPNLDVDQAAMVRALAGDGAGVSVVVGKAGTGKSTAIRAYRAACDAAGIPVIGVAPSASAAHQLAQSAGITDSATVDRLLVEIEHGHRRLPRGVVVVLAEAGMSPTRTRLALQQAIDAVGGKVVDVGDLALAPGGELAIVRHHDHAAISGVDRDLIVGGCHRAGETDLGRRYHAVTPAAQQFGDAVVDVVVEQEPHYAVAEDRRTDSRSSRVRSGNASRMRSSGRPRAR